MRALLDQAVALHGQGRLDEAARLYEQILAVHPNLMDARHMLGFCAPSKAGPTRLMT